MVMADVRPRSRADRTVHVVAFLPFDFDLNGGVVDLELTVQFEANGTENLLSLSYSLFSNKDVAAAGDHTGAIVGPLERVREWLIQRIAEHATRIINEPHQDSRNRLSHSSLGLSGDPVAATEQQGDCRDEGSL
jgi:hypothetical protein